MLFRIHRRNTHPWWFSSDGSGRFDLRDDPQRGTCYLAEDPLGSFVEVFQEYQDILPGEVAARVLKRTSPRAFRLADATDGRARRFGVTAALHASEDYERTQAWAAAFAAAGFDGIRYLVSHDPRARLVGVALFGPKGTPRWAKGRSGPIPAAVIKEAEQRFGLRVLPPPRGRD